MAESIRVEVAFAEPGRQFLRRVELPAGATLADALAASGIEALLGARCATLDVGVWSKPATRERVLGEGDRVELYRPLKVDPKEARRRRAERAGR